MPKKKTKTVTEDKPQSVAPVCKVILGAGFICAECGEILIVSLMVNTVQCKNKGCKNYGVVMELPELGLRCKS